MLLMLSACLLASCAGSGSDFLTDCVLPETQVNSLNGAWPTLPVPLAFRTNDWDSTQKTSIQKAASSWNSFFKASKNIPKALEFKPDSAQTPFQLCNNNIVAGEEFTDSVKVMKTTSGWPSAQSSVIAITLFCLNFQNQGSNGLPSIFNASMDFNFDDFNNAGQKIPDLQSIMLHELGHLLSMDHSCGVNKNGLLTCDSEEMEPSFFAAVMFPTVEFPNGVNGEVKRSLQENDQGRANCLYDGS